MSASSKRIFSVTLPLLGLLFVTVAAVHVISPPDCHEQPPEQMNIVFDKTNGYSPTQAHSVDRTLVELLNRAADHAEINLYYITSNGERPDLVLSECKPTTRGNPLFVDVEEQKRAFRRLVVTKLKKYIDQHFQPRGPAPILESLATIGRQRIVTAKLELHVPTEFDLYSDMVQDSKNASLARPGAGDGAAEPADGESCTSGSSARSDAFAPLYADVKRFYRDVPVNVFAIHRDPSTSPRYPGERCIRSFWEGTFPHLTWMTL
jgi:hypothetical protein